VSGRAGPFKATRDDVSRVLRAALEEAEAIADSDSAYQQASWLVDQLSASMTASGRLRAEAARRIRDENHLSLSQLGERIGVSKARAADMLRVPQTRGPELPPVIAPVVTSDLGVLAARRAGKKSAWAFIAAQQQPGEAAGDAAVRAIKDQAGLDIKGGRTIVREADPHGGPSTIYLVAQLADPGQPGASPAGRGEWAEVRWLQLTEAEELLPDMHGPVHAYLSRALRPR
jgi:ADP-ribose pyrophosphatase YjhB (NUDIX family)